MTMEPAPSDIDLDKQILLAVGRLEAQLADIKREQEAINGRITILMLGKDQEAPPGTKASDWLLELIHDPGQMGGVVLDPGVARKAGPCLCYELKPGSDLCYQHGIIGPLTREQQDLYCPDKAVRHATPEQEARLEKFRQAAERCKGEGAELTEVAARFQKRVECFRRELSERGEKVT